MARDVAHLGRPETPDETAARKAESSRVYRASQTTRNLIAALIATLAVVAIVVLIVPRGDLTQPEEPKVAEIAERISEEQGRPLVVPAVPEKWRANSAKLAGSNPSEWQLVYSPGKGEGFVRVTQGINADAGWAARELTGSALDATVTLGGLEWQSYTFRDPAKAGNVEYALAAQAGADTVLVYGSSSKKMLTQVAEELAPQLTEIAEATK